MKIPTLWIVPLSCLALAGQSYAQTADSNRKAGRAYSLDGLKYKVGQRVEYVDNGKWFKAVIIAVRDDSADHYDHKIYAPYRVHPLGYNEYEERWVCCANDGDARTQLRPAGSGPTEPVPGGEANEQCAEGEG